MAALPAITVTPLAGEQLIFRSLVGDEVMNGLFEYEVQVLSKNGDIKLGAALGASMTVHVPLTGGGVRHFNGLVVKLTRIGQLADSFLYRAILRPWMWLLSRSSDCRIFQNQNVPTIVGKILRKAPLHPFDQSLGEYQPRDFLVQYRETDLNFVNRLLEDEGIGYHHVHEADKHTLVLTDPQAKLAPAPGYAEIPLVPATSAGDQECFVTWNASQEIQSAAYLLKDFDYEKPRVTLAAPLSTKSTPDFRVLGELYDYPGRFLTTDAGNRLVGIRLEQAQMYYETFLAAGPVRGVGVGNVFTLGGPLAVGPQRQYLIIGAHYEVHGAAPRSTGGGDKGESFTCSITAIDAKVPYRPARITPRPIVQGPHTAIVVDPKKEDHNEDPAKNEIWTDSLGRVLVNFHWERLGNLKPHDPDRAGDDADNDKGQCWLRVAQLWAGSGFGTVFIPRIGHEVIVEFLEGDPDRPIITGQVYNQDHKPAYLGDSKPTQSGIRSHSTPGGGPKNYNELRFDDKKGSEEVYIQAEKDQLNHVKNNRTATVGASDSITVGGDRSVTVTGNLSVTVKGGGKSEFHSLQDVTGKYKLHATDSIDLEAPNYIKLKVGDTYLELTPDKITLHAKGQGEIIVNADVDAHANGKAKLYLNGDANLSSPGNTTINATANARVEGKETTVHGDSKATVESAEVSVHGTSKVTVYGGGATLTSTSSGIDAHGTLIGLNS